ncbi:MAG TPA: OmpH family outer membrane protein [Myxococcales bacterium]|nr:OmpH family outer membrane protein [Myxococcales bacterium]
MRRILLAFTVALAARTASAQNMKIGYVDVQRAVQEVEEGKAARSRLQAELAQKRTDLDKKRADLEKMKADYDKQAPVLSEDAKRQKQEQLQKAFVDAQTAAGQMQEELSGKEQEAMQSISKRLLQVVAEVSDKENFTFVLDKSALLYAPAASDLTNEVVRRYNERFGSGQAATTTKPKTPPAGKAAAPPKK